MRKPFERPIVILLISLCSLPCSAQCIERLRRLPTELKLAVFNEVYGMDRTLTGWGMQHVLVGHQSPVYSAEFNADNSTLMTKSADSTVHIWRLDTGGLLNTLHECDPQAPASTDLALYKNISQDPIIGISPNETMLACMSTDYNVSVLRRYKATDFSDIVDLAYTIYKHALRISGNRHSACREMVYLINYVQGREPKFYIYTLTELLIERSKVPKHIRNALRESVNAVGSLPVAHTIDRSAE